VTILDAARESYNKFNEALAARAADWRAKVAKLRADAVVNHELATERANQQTTDAVLRRVEEASWQYRFNHLALEDERCRLRRWASLPRAVPDAFQLALPAHPLAFPSLLVPSSGSDRAAGLRPPSSRGPRSRRPPPVLPDFVSRPCFGGLPRARSARCSRRASGSGR
jgi:hypothetical protein